MTKIVIIDTGCANLASVKFALTRLGYTVEISHQAESIQSADKLILPGVGTAKAAMQNLSQRQLIPLLKQCKQPLLGICLGMQLMSQFSEEGEVEMLNIIPYPTQKLANCNLPLPHMGWNTVQYQSNNHPLFVDIPQHSYFYFVHSYGIAPNPYTIATCEYGEPFSAVLQNKNFYGAQFHPERSGKMGALFLRNFIENTN